MKSSKRIDLVDVASRHLSEDSVNKFSSYLGESPAKVRKAFDDAVPSVFSGLIHRATDRATTRSIGELLLASGPAERRVLDDFSGAISTTAGAELLTLRGQGLLSVIFGGKLDGAIDSVSRSSGVSRGSADKVLALAAPLVVAVVSRESLSRGLGPSEIADLLTEQKEFVGLAFERVHQRVTKGVPVKPVRVSHRIGAGVPLLALGALALIAIAIFVRERPDTAPRATAPNVSRIGEVTITGAEVPGPKSGVAPAASTTSAPHTMLTLDGFSRDNHVAPEGKHALDQLAAELTRRPEAKVRIAGYSDDTGISASSERASVDRANAVRRMLVDRGIDASRITAIGYGDAKPISGNDTARGRAQNRRVEISIY